MVFRCASFWFWVPGTHFWDPGTKIWTQDLEIGPGLARGGFGTQNGGWKNTVLRGNGFEHTDYGISRDQNGSYGTQEAFGKASFPPNPFYKCFPPTFSILENLGKAPWSPCISPMGPLWAYIPIQLPINHPWWPLLLPSKSGLRHRRLP